MSFAVPSSLLQSLRIYSNRTNRLLLLAICHRYFLLASSFLLEEKATVTGNLYFNIDLLSILTLFDLQDYFGKMLLWLSLSEVSYYKNLGYESHLD